MQASSIAILVVSLSVGLWIAFLCRLDLKEVWAMRRWRRLNLIDAWGRTQVQRARTLRAAGADPSVMDLRHVSPPVWQKMGNVVSLTDVRSGLLAEAGVTVYGGPIKGYREAWGLTHYTDVGIQPAQEARRCAWDESAASARQAVKSIEQKRAQRASQRAVEPGDTPTP